MEGIKIPARVSQLDALRAFAIGVVMIHHYRDTRFFLSGFGATLFFVLSGFFATKTLLKLRSGVETGRASAVQSIKTFYLKRWLRLWPLYYLVLALTLVLGVENARSSLIWNAVFLSNIHVLMTGSWSGRFSPLWSLSVLEQFYMLWPAFIIFCPKKAMLPSILALIALAPLYRVGCFLANASPLYWCVVPCASFDQLGCGALLALCTEKAIGTTAAGMIHSVARNFFLPVFMVLLVCKSWNVELPFSAIYIGTVASFAFLWLVNRAARGFSGPVGRLMESPMLGHVGRMSYAIYLLHDFTELLVPRTGMVRLLLESNYKALLLIPLTILVAHIAWRFIESPILSLRRKYILAPVGPCAVPEAQA